MVVDERESDGSREAMRVAPGIDLTESMPNGSQTD
jgi:hypothetical protein